MSGLARFVAVKTAVSWDEIVAGAVYVPYGVIVPAPAGLIDHAARVGSHDQELDPVAMQVENRSVCPTVSVAVGGESGEADGYT
jgi:hypothetical protein